MPKINRTIRVGFVVGLLFFCWYMRDVLFHNWRFRLFSANDWEFVWREFKAGWTISTAYEWAWLVTVILMIPLFLLLWWGSVKISWRKSFMTVFGAIVRWFRRLIYGKPNAQDIVRKKIKLKGKASHKKVRPQPMIPGGGRPSIKKTGRTMDAKQELPAEAQTVQSANPSAPMYQMSASSAGNEETAQKQEDFLNEDVRNIRLEDIKMPEKIRLEEDLPAIFRDNGYQVIQDAVFDGKTVPYIGVSGDRIVLALTDTDKGDWLADEEFFNGEEPLWFSETSSRISPVYVLLTLMKNFGKKLTDAGLTQTVMPILIEKEGTVINAGDMLEIWKQAGVIVCRTDLGGPEELQPFGQALPKAEQPATDAAVIGVQNLLGK